MSDDPVDPVATDAAEETKAEKNARLKRAAELLGDLVPTTTRDETSEGWSERSGTSREEELLRDVPPHHG